MNHTIGVEPAQQSLRAQIKYPELLIFDGVFAVQVPHEKLKVALPANTFAAEWLALDQRVRFIADRCAASSITGIAARGAIAHQQPFFLVLRQILLDPRRHVDQRGNYSLGIFSAVVARRVDILAVTLRARIGRETPRLPAADSLTA